MAKHRDDEDQPKKPGKTPPPPPSEDDIDFFSDEEVAEEALEIEDETPSKKPAAAEGDEEILDAIEAEPADDDEVEDIFAEDAEEVEEAALADEVVEEEIAAAPAASKPVASADIDIFADDVFAEEAKPAAPAEKEEEPIEAVEEAIEEAIEEAQEAEAVAEEVVEAEEAEPVAKAEEAKVVAEVDEAIAEAEEAVAEAEEALEDYREAVADLQKGRAGAEAEEAVEEAEEAVAEAEEVVEEAEEAVAEAEEAVEEAEEAKPVAASAKPPVSEDDIDLNEIFGEEKSEGEKETVGDFKVDDAEAEPVAAKAAVVAKAEAADEIAEAEEEDDEKPVAVAVAKKPTKPAAKPVRPKYFRRWVAGFLLGIITVAGAGAAIWYFKPDLLAQAFHSIPESPNGQNVFAKPDPMTSPAVQAALQQREEQAKTLQASFDQLAKANQAAQGALKKAQDIANSAAANTAKLNAKIAQAEQDRKAMEAQLNNIVGALVAGKIVQDKNKLDAAAVGKELLELANSKLAVAAINKRLQEAKIGDAGEKGVEKLLGTLQDLERKANELDQLLANVKVKGVQDLVDLRKRLEAERNELDAMIKAAYAEMVAAKIVSPSGDPRKELVAGAKAAGQRSQSPLTSPLTQLASALSSLATGPASLLQRGADTAAVTGELAYYRLREPFIQGPEQKLDTWIAELLEGQARPSELATAMREANWVRSKESRAGSENRAKALLVLGLVHRNQGRFAEAVKTLQSASSEVQSMKLNAAWTAQLKSALGSLSDPTAYFTARLEALLYDGNWKGAIAELDSAIKAMPNDGRLLALRSQIQLDRASGSIPEAMKKQIEQDLAAARKDPRAAAEAAFAQGRLQEEVGNLDEAEKLYRQAIQAHKGNEDDGARYRIALARLLQRDRTFTGVAPVAPAPQKVEPKVEPKKAEPAKVGQMSSPDALATLLMLALVGVQHQDDEELSPAAAARLQESIKLAKDLIKSKDPKIKSEGHMLLGKALAKQGRRTEGLKEYIRGLEIITPGASSQELSKMVEEHPAFQQPDTLARPNPALAEHHFGRGMSAYWNKDYPSAEEQFKQAVSYYNQDARYQYFLGLSQIAQKTKLKRDAAYHAFEQGARLEAMNRPPISDINASLERLQGDLRQFLNSFRSKR